MFKLKKNQKEESAVEESVEKENDYKETDEQDVSVDNQENEEKQTVSIQSVAESEKKSKKEKEQKVIKWGPNRILQCFAYFSIALIAIAMILRLIFKNQPDIAVYMQGVGECLAYIVCIWLGFYFTRKRGNIWWLVGWIIASVILVIFYIFAIV